MGLLYYNYFKWADSGEKREKELVKIEAELLRKEEEIKKREEEIVKRGYSKVTNKHPA
ncbi:hypothetical protein I3843_12G025500 [Carya illinoinensis]|uniref:Uncharacterized protein n=1 Tax=Carya illinoinensis TaxID=32201 RepID=A0A922IUP8_CARIL|nr:hypothetical protein I3842_12G024200 [Carya illinoinensis]KAG7951764.1 hypothetical protein I3843_12G025500 [Carya illinoinensis]